MPKIAMIGAGSVVFTKNLLGDILSFPALAEAHIALMDIDPERLRIAEIMARKVAAALNVPATISAHLERKPALEGADYVINTIQVGGFEATLIDFEVPKKYGLKQTIADTLGIGGIFRALRTIPVMLALGKDMEEVCPKAILINYTNPMAMLTWAMLKATKIHAVGLCHSVQGTAHMLARYLDLPPQEVSYLCAGINHMAFYLRFEHHGEDLYPRLWEAMKRPEIYNHNKVRWEAFRRLGYFVTESSEHFAEYNPWFIKRDRPDLVEKLDIPIDEYVRRCIDNNEWWEKNKAAMESDQPVEVHRSAEYGSLIINAHHTNTSCIIHGSKLNTGIIPNLPEGSCVEVPCVADGNGVTPCYVGNLPPQLAALIRTNVNVQELVVEAALTHKKEHVYHAAMMDPHTAAELSLDQIESLVNDLFEAHHEALGGWFPK